MMLHEKNVIRETDNECLQLKVPLKILYANAKDNNEQRGWLTFKTKLVWENIIIIVLLHVVSVYYLFTAWSSSKIMTRVWEFFVLYVGFFGITAGVHRLWSHRSYKAKLPLRVILLICYFTAGQHSIHTWVRDHRVHHKHTETNADPHDSRRGFFFSHVGWLMMKKHPEVVRCGNKIDMSDVLDDPVVAFGQRYYWLIRLSIGFIIPSLVPVICWGECWYNAILGQVFLRYSCCLNGTWCINSVAHIWGTRPYDRSLAAVQNLTASIVTLGEGWHNYHHAFPWDYKAAEHGNYTFNLTTMFIDMFAKIGWAYDLKQPSKDLVGKVALKYGDGTHPEWHEATEPNGKEEDVD